MWPNWRKPHWGPKHYQILVSQETAKEFILPGSIFAIAADTKSTDTIWFVYIVDVEEAIDEKLDSYGHAIPPCHMFVRARYLERMGDTKKGQKVKLMLKNFFYIRRVLFISLSTLSKRRTTILSRSLHFAIFFHMLNKVACAIICYHII